MARYTVMLCSFIDNRIVEEGEVIDYTPPKGTTVGDNLKIARGSKSPSTDDTGADPAAGDATDPTVDPAPLA